ncbi:MAG: hypothetical protein KDA93_21445 [Planctomycetaceae bacterium]|nr:hypothetical protein [Planctomycetaceae bacterium]
MSEVILSTCPHCEASLRFKDRDFLGKKARCPSCLEPFVIKQTGISTADLGVMSDTKQLPGRKTRTDEKPRSREKVKQRPSVKSQEKPKRKVAQPVQQSRRKTASLPPRQLRPTQPRKPVSPKKDDWLSDDVEAYESEEIENLPPRREDKPVPASRPRKKRKRKRKNAYNQEQTVFVSVIFALMGGSVAAVIGGVAWIGIVIATGYEFGILAWGIGGLVGFGVLLSSRDHIVGDVTGIIAGMTAILAVTAPKLLLYLVVMAAGAGGQIGFGDIFTPLDALWIFLAGVTAYRVGSGQVGE